MALKSRLIDDAARLAGGTVGILSNIRGQIKQEVRATIDDIASRMNFVPRDEFERLEAVVQQQRLDLAELKKSLKNPAPAQKKAAKNPTKKKT
jgi:BMFP domain-containing protein YqiC